MSQAVFAQQPLNASGGRISDATAKKIDEVFVEWNKPDSLGCALGIVRDGSIAYERGYGMASLENNIPITPQTVFDIASVSKQFTAMAVLLLAQQGKLSLDDDVRKYVPELPRFGKPITVRQLVYHTNGLRDDYYLLELAGWRYDDEIREEDVLALVKRMKELNHEPGAEHSYNNTGYALLALIVNRVSGQSLREFSENQIFKPLGMFDSQFRDDHTMVIKNRANSYEPKNGGGFSLSMGAVAAVGPNGVFTDIEDLAKWDQNFYDKKIGGESGIREMITPGTLNDGTRLSYAFGLRVEDYKNLKMIWHSGAGAGTRTSYLRFPEQHSSVILLCNLNSIDMDSLARRVADIYLADEFKKVQASGTTDTDQNAPSAKVSGEDLKKFAGLYFDSDFGRLRRIYVKNGKLYFFRNAGNESELSPLDKNRFLMLGVPGRAEVVFKAAQTNSPPQMLLIVGDNKPAVFESVQPAAYSLARLTEFAGNYYSEELDATYIIKIQKNNLVLERKKWNDIKLTPVFADAFGDDYLGVIRLTRNRQNKISGFTLSNGNRGVRRLRFSKVR